MENKKAVVIYGLPGAGKGTQANLFVAVLGLHHFDTGKFIERFVHDPQNQDNEIVKRERSLFDEGKLNTPSWILKIMQEKIGKLANADLSIVFSGSPRTMFEAFGDSENQGLIENLERLYGRENVHFIRLNVPSLISIWRNCHRMICSTCSAIILDGAMLSKTKAAGKAVTYCPFCASLLYKRVLDNPETMTVRLKEYEERTEPVIKELRSRGYKIKEIDGIGKPYKIFGQILSKL